MVLSVSHKLRYVCCLGMSAEQLQGVTQMMSNMPPEALAQLMGAMGRGGAPPGVHTIQLTEEDAEAVNRYVTL